MSVTYIKDSTWNGGINKDYAMVDVQGHRFILHTCIPCRSSRSFTLMDGAVKEDKKRLGSRFDITSLQYGVACRFRNMSEGMGMGGSRGV